MPYKRIGGSVKAPDEKKAASEERSIEERGESALFQVAWRELRLRV